MSDFSLRLPRRVFLQATAGAIAGTAISGTVRAAASEPAGSALEATASRLLATWGEALLRFQVRDPRDPALYGGLLCPACVRIHGRVGDTMYPFLRLARSTGDARFVDAARLVFAWMENMSREDGSWINDSISDWRGTTVFAAIALAEALKKHGALLPDADRRRVRDRLARAAQFLDGFLTPTVGNVNYRMSAPLAFALVAEVLDEPRYRDRARTFATIVRGNFLPSGFVFGEGHPNDRVSPRGCRAIDLGYNVEESLPNLASYAVLAGDRELLELVTKSMRTHLDFLLPDGGWDNSWGTRSYKWTYWGSRTSDGASPALVIAGDPVSLEAALRNLQLLERNTRDGLLHGGPHLHHTGQRACLHHTFSHAKALAAILDHGIPSHAGPVALPREAARGVRHYADIDTWLVSRGPWRATVTANDWQYVAEGHASGGALSLLWHERVGVLASGSMTRYQLVEPNNQPLHTRPAAPLTPAIEVAIDGTTYTSLNDHSATVESREVEAGHELVSTGLLRDGAQKVPASPVSYRLVYRFTDTTVQIHARAGGTAQLVLPLVASSEEPAVVTENAVEITKAEGRVRVTSTRPLRALAAERVFNHVPGFQALVLRVDLQENPDAILEIRIIV